MDKDQYSDQRIHGKDLEKEMETTGFRCSWKKIETAVQDRA